MKNSMEKTLKQMFQEEKLIIDANRLGKIRQNILDQASRKFPELRETSPFRQFRLALASIGAVFLISLGLLWILNDKPRNPLLSQIEKLIEDEQQLNRLIVVLDEFISTENPFYPWETPNLNVETGIITKNDFLFNLHNDSPNWSSTF